MFIELTDHLRCTAGHEEQFLVLLPTAMDGRRVTAGELGCPVCGRVVSLVDGTADFGEGTPASGPTALTAEAVAALLGLTGPGGWIALAGVACAVAEGLRALVPGVALALVNPPPRSADTAEASVLRAGRLPLKRGSMRGVVLGADAAKDPGWVADAAAVVLPGLRLVVESAEGPPDGVELLGSAGGVWVGRVAARR